MAFFQKARTSSSSSADSFLCPVCNEEYQDEPKQLPCLHTICQDCLCDAAAEKNALKIYCPIDGQELPLPMGGIKMLPTDFRVLRLVETRRGQNKTRSERKPREPRKEKPEKTERKKTRNTDEDSGPPLQLWEFWNYLSSLTDFLILFINLSLVASSICTVTVQITGWITS